MNPTLAGECIVSVSFCFLGSLWFRSSASLSYSVVMKAGREPTVRSVSQKTAVVSSTTTNHYSELTLISLSLSHDTDATGGYCNEPEECFCNFGYSGENCEIGESPFRLQELLACFSQPCTVDIKVYAHFRTQTFFLQYTTKKHAVRLFYMHT